MDINNLKLFVLAAETLNISAAGRMLGLAPAVAGARIAKLESELDVVLLHRSTRKVSVSIEGEAFLPYAREILEQEAAARSALGQYSADVTGTIRFAASSTFAQLYISPLLGEFTQTYPKISLELKLTDSKIDMFEGAFDLALRNYALPDSSLKARKLAEDKRILCASPQYLKTRSSPRSPDDLQAHSLLQFDGPARSLKNREKPEAGTYFFPPAGYKAALLCDDGATIRQATIAGAGISMNSLWCVADDLRTGKLVQVLPEYYVADEAAIWLVYPNSHILTPKVRLFIDFLIEKIGTPPIWERL